MKTLLSLILLVILVIGGVALRNIITINNNIWICENGEWIPRGIPDSPHPDAGCNGNTSKTDMPSADDITDKNSCESAGGSWGRVGIEVSESRCNLPTSDGGKSCVDSVDCEGWCIAELSPQDQDKVQSQRAVIEKSGKCSGWQIVSGCFPVVTQGVINGLMCID